MVESGLIGSVSKRHLGKAVVKMTSLTISHQNHASGHHARRVMVIKLLLKIANREGRDPIEDASSRRLLLLIERVRDAVSFSYTKDPDYGACLDDEGETRVIFVYFPSIVMDNDPIYQILTRNIARSLNDARLFEDIRERFGIVRWNEKNVVFDIDPQPVENFEEALNARCDSISSQHLQAQRRCTTTAHTIALSADRFSMLLEYYIAIHCDDRGDKEANQMFFRKNIRYIVGAYHRQRKHTTYAEREREHVTCEDWLMITRVFGVDDATAARYYLQVEDYAYTTVTMEEVLKRYSTNIANKLDRHNTEKIRHMIKLLILQEHTPSADQLWEVFAEFIRNDHFYADKEIWVLDESKCIKRPANELRPVVRRFTNHIREGRISIQIEEQKVMKSVSEIDDRIHEMCKPFENTSSCKFVESACSNYLSTRMKTAIRRSAIAFRDCVLVYDKDLKTLTQRQAYMEDQFTSTTPVVVQGFGHLQSHKAAIAEVMEALRKMFKHKNNVHWIIKWMGSLLAHLPERTCCIMYGPKGGNAKSTFANVLHNILGENSTQCRPDLLITNKNGGQTCTPFESELKDKVLAVISEPQKTQVYSSSTLKDMTGGDLKTAAKKYKDPETFEQTAKPLILSNHMIQFDDVDQPLRDRLFITHCHGRFNAEAPESIDEQEERSHYPADSSFWSDERKQALAYIMIHIGFPAYAKEGLLKTEEQVEELNKWSADSSPFMQFAQMCEGVHDGSRWWTNAHDVYNTFKCKYPKRYDTLTYDVFLKHFEKDALKITTKIGGTDYFHFYHRDCKDNMPDM